MKTTVVNSTTNSYDVYIGRPGIWGNPFRSGVDGTREEVIQMYKTWIMYSSEAEDLRKQLHSLKGKRLGCWCKPKSCHGDVLVEIIESSILELIK